jgi:hypothetical protein
MHVALGWLYRGHRVQQGAVVYLALEGGTGFPARKEAWRQRHLPEHHDPVPFYLLDVPVDLIADRDKLITSIKVQLGDRNPAVVAVDTLNRALMGDENKSEDMAKFIRAADMIRGAFGCAVIIVHHCGVQGSRPRGHTSLPGADDAQIAVERDNAGNVRATVEHMKDGEAGAVMVSRLERVVLDKDSDGDEITSCVVVEVEGEATVRHGPKVSGAAKIALDLLRKALDEAGEKPSASNHIPPGVRTCRTTTWRGYCEQGMVTKGDSPDSKRKAFVRAVEKLRAQNIIGLWSDWVWLTGLAGQGRTK